MPISWNMVIFKIRLIFASDERRIVSVMAIHCVIVLGKPIDPCQQKKQCTWREETGVCDIVQINGLHQNTVRKAFPNTCTINFTLVGPKNQAEFENDGVSRNEHSRIKIAQPISMILVSFSFAEDVLC